MLYSKNELLDEVIDASSSVLFYGVAGAGKTTLMLTIASNLCNIYTCIYITTEDTSHYEHVARHPEKFEKALFTEAYDLDTLVKVAFASSLIKPHYIFIDSVNALFRVEALKEGALAKYAFVVGFLLNLVSEVKGKLFASAQVRTGESGELEVSGFKVLDYYFDTIIGVFIESTGVRFIKPIKTPIKPLFDKLYFRITDEGVHWIEHA